MYMYDIFLKGSSERCFDYDLIKSKRRRLMIYFIFKEAPVPHKRNTG